MGVSGTRCPLPGKRPPGAVAVRRAGGASGGEGQAACGCYAMWMLQTTQCPAQVSLACATYMSRIVAILALAKPARLGRLAAAVSMLPASEDDAVAAGVTGTRAIATFAKRLETAIRPLSDEIRMEVEPLGEAILDCGEEYLRAATRSCSYERPEDAAESARKVAKAARNLRRAWNRFGISEPVRRFPADCQPVAGEIAVA